MSKILVKAQQQNVYNLNGSGTTGMAYVLRPVRCTTMNAEDIINYCSANSIVPKAYLSASMIATASRRPISTRWVWSSSTSSMCASCPVLS